MTITLRLPWERRRPGVPAEGSHIWDGDKPFVLMQVNDELRVDRHVITLIYAEERPASAAGKAA